MDAALVLGVAAALAFAFTNGLHDAANAIAGLVATRAATPAQAVVLASVFNIVGPLVAGSAVADTVAGVVTVPGAGALAVVGAALTAAVAWNLVTWRRGLPSSSGHALVGGLCGAALVEGGTGAVRWGGIEEWRPVGVFGILIALAVSPVLGLAVALGLGRLVRRGLARATRRVGRPIRAGQWVMSATLAASHGANDAQKATGLVVVLLVAAGRAGGPPAPLWATLSCAVMLTLGTALGGWPIVRTIGRRLFRLRPADALVSETASSAVILSATALGAPISTTQVVTAAVVGSGGGRRRWHHVRWLIARRVGLAWLVTIPATALLAAALLPAWEALS